MEEIERQAAEQLGLAVRLQRTKLRLSQEKLSERTGMERTYLSDIENGKRNVSLATLVRLSCALECTLSELFSEVSLKPARKTKPR